MPAYLLTFRLADDPGYSQRYDALVEAVNAMSTQWWVEPSSFFLFSSEKNIDGVAATVKQAINPAKDIALIGMPDYKSARLIGASLDKDVFDLMPFTKKV